MGTITFDTLKYAERLKAAGVSEPQAKAEAEALRDVLAEALDTSLATKADVTRLEKRMDSFESKLESMEQRLTIKLGAFLAVAVGFMLTVLKIH
ncbi:MAG: DUF1640 domain-containing protein [Rhodoferax sp.]|nr:DUF1640 domain-containing protein [Rhodoferax sp.]